MKNTARKRASQGMKVTPACDLVFGVTRKGRRIGRRFSFDWFERARNKFWDWKLDCDVVLWQNVSLSQAKAACMPCASLRRRWKIKFSRRKLVFLKFSQLSGCWQGEDVIKLFAQRHDPGMSSCEWKTCFRYRRMWNYKFLGREVLN